MSDFEYTFKVIVFADRNVGKKELFPHINISGASQSRTAIGVEMGVKNIEVDGLVSRLLLWVCFLDPLDKRLIHYLNGSNGAILMYDITNRDTLDFVAKLNKIIEKRINIPVLLVGNKKDLESNRDVSSAHLNAFKTQNNISETMEISLKTGEDVEQMFVKIIKMMFLNEV